MKFIALMSNGIDSPVATYLLSRKEEDIVLMYADNRLFTDKRGVEKFLCLARQLSRHITGRTKIFLIPHGEILSVIKQKCNKKMICVLCKRMMLRYAEKIAEKEKADALIMGDSLGQVASQTLQNIRVVEQATSLPVLRPLIGLDKEDIIRIAKKIGTYNISILPSQECTAVPKKPATKAKLEDVLYEEKKINVEKHVEEIVKKAKTMYL
ncbi:MAG: hypothetical protein DRN05_05440 [Thermoplasmata archaeon]|nr:MAG: hypothetical protein DRN05_05440 [Thermoplasmata archaeon]